MRASRFATLAVVAAVGVLTAVLAGGCSAGTTTTGSSSATATTTASKAPTKAQVLAFVNEAYGYAQEVGRDKAIAAFMDTKGRFYHDGLYIFAYDYKGTVLCLAAEPAKVGENRWDIKDPKGVYFVRELAKLAASGGSGWLDYQYVNPAQDYQVQQKSSFVRGVDATWFLGAGTYSPLP